MNRREYIQQAQRLTLPKLIKLYKYHQAEKDDLLIPIREILDLKIESANEAELYRACQAEGIPLPLAEVTTPPRTVRSPAPPLPHPFLSVLFALFPRKKIDKATRPLSRGGVATGESKK